MKLKDLREAKGLSVIEVAEILGVSRQAVYGWENGERFPSMKKIIELERVYGDGYIDAIREQGAENGRD